jgi:uncharacterized membrane protein (DUF2068 family)
MDGSGGKKKITAGFLAIILFKWFKGVVFLLVGIAALKLLHAGTLPSAREIARFFNASPENELVRKAAELVRRVTPLQFKWVAVVSLTVAVVFLAEGALLAARIWWSTYFTIALTACGIPLEIWEILHRPESLRRYFLLLVNLAILLFVWTRRHEFKESA